MRHAVAFAFVSIALALPVWAASVQPGAAAARPAEPDVTVILNFKGTYTAPAIAEMKKEAASILKAAGLRLGWTSAAGAEGRSFHDLLVMTFKGACMFQPAPPRYDELGPYASTIATDGVIQPFGTVDCDHIAGSARSAMNESIDADRGDLLVGRALGRVVAHELVHMLTHSSEHGREGVAKPFFTAKQLVENSFVLSPEDVDRLRVQLNLR